MVDVRVRQQHGADPGGLEGKRTIVESAQRLRPLEHAAVDQQLAMRA